MVKKKKLTRVMLAIIFSLIIACGSIFPVYAADSDQTDNTSSEQTNNTLYSNEWAEGIWYNSDGTQTYCFKGTWKCDSHGWWFQDSSGWYPQSMWQVIDGEYYYFNSTGYIDTNCYRDGCWLGSDGTWNKGCYGGRWFEDGNGWWYVDASGWMPVSQLVWIDGSAYWFDSYGYSDEESWALLLVNQYNPVPDNYEVDLTILSNEKMVDSRIYPSLQEMFNDARAEGLDMYVREGYRTTSYQQAIMNNRIQQYQSQGYSYAKAVQLAEQYVAVPGRSEHETGLAVDINASNDSSSDDVYAWLDENAYKYGFIKRYPEDKSDITGINYEPWHYRYVGKKAAAEMKEMNLCLEEYLSY